MATTYKRFDLIDTIRGLTILSMIGFHACWIASYFGLYITWEMIRSPLFLVWERSICIPFIFISGFVFVFGRHHIRRGLTVLGIGVLITIGSVIFLYDLRDIFGVLWIIGLSQLIMILPDKQFSNLERKFCNDSSEQNGRKTSLKKLYLVLFVVFLLLFLITYNINEGYLGFGSCKIVLSKNLYKGLFMTFLGFIDPRFYSVDYFSFMPWFFMYVMGYFAQKLSVGTKFRNNVLTKGIPLLSAIGRHSLTIYLIHPVALYAIMFIIWKFMQH